MLVSTVITGENDNTSTQVCSVLKYRFFFGFSPTCDFFNVCFITCFLISFLCESVSSL